MNELDSLDIELKKRKIPEYLYHYTSLSTLALILESDSIRLNRLDNVNDLQEARTTNIGDISSQIFVSCWCGKAEELLYMWKFYGDNLQGVRIRLKPESFLFYFIPAKDGKINSYSLVPQKEIVAGEEFLVPDFQFPLYQVQYVYDTKALDQKVLQPGKDMPFFNASMVGTYKEQHWAAEQEWRLKVVAVPKGIEPDGTKINPILRLMKGYRSKRTEIFVKLHYPRIESVEITLGPCISPGDRLLAEALAERNSRKTKISLVDSCLTGKVR